MANTHNSKPMIKLSPAQISDFDRLEKVIESGKQTFVDVGLAITEIRDKKLYGRDYDTFEAYCQQRWGWKRRYAYNLIEAAAVVEGLPEMCAIAHKITNEGQARALAPLPPKEQVKVLKAIEASGEPVTAAAIKKHYPPPPSSKKPNTPPPPTQPAKPAKPPEPEPELDRTGLPIPAKVLPMWKEAFKWQEILTAISKAKCAVESAREDKDKTAVEISQSAISDLKSAYTHIKTAIPFAICPACKGAFFDSCTMCKGRGYVSEFMWTGPCVTTQQRDFREKQAQSKAKK
jgi:hypothetical protein